MSQPARELRIQIFLDQTQLKAFNHALKITGLTRYRFAKQAISDKLRGVLADSPHRLPLQVRQELARAANLEFD